MAMREQQIRTALEPSGSACAAGGLDAEPDVYPDNAVGFSQTPLGIRTIESREEKFSIAPPQGRVYFSLS
jgi:hypothetical protein